MQFELSEEQQDLRAFLRELLEQRASSAQVRATLAAEAPYDEALWSVLCEQIGAASLAIPEEYGGAGFTTRETHLVLEELGRALAPSPFLGSVAIAAQAIVACDDEAAKQRLLPTIASGEHIAALAWATPAGQWDPAAVSVIAEPRGDNWSLNGTVPYVLDGGYADTLLTIAQTPEGPALFVVTDTATAVRTVTPTLDQTIHLATLQFEATPAQWMGGSAALLETISQHALTAITALQLGTASRALDDTVEYSKQRTQFGRQIGSFQALKHRMADMHVRLETARTTSYAAAWAQANSDPDWGRLSRLAKATVGDALTHIAGEMIQLHGGIAITWEHDAHLMFKRAHATAQLFGTPEAQREARARELGLV